MIEAVLFDLDGVITDSAHYHYMAWKALAERLDIPFDEEYNEKLKGVSRMESLELILKNGGVEQAFSEEEKLEMATWKNDEYRLLIQQITPEDVLPGIMDFLAELKEAGIPAGVASVSKNAMDIIHSLKMEDCFGVVVDAAEISRAKPFPDVFLEGARALGATPEKCIGIEDARAGIEAIRSAGMKAVGVGTPAEMQDADLIIQDTAQLNLKLLQTSFDL